MSGATRADGGPHSLRVRAGVPAHAARVDRGDSLPIAEARQRARLGVVHEIGGRGQEMTLDALAAGLGREHDEPAAIGRPVTLAGSRRFWDATLAASGRSAPTGSTSWAHGLPWNRSRMVIRRIRLAGSPTCFHG